MCTVDAVMFGKSHLLGVHWVIQCDIGTIYKSLSLKHFVVLGNFMHVFWENSATFLENVEKYVLRNDTGLLLRKQLGHYHPHRTTHCTVIKVAPVVVRVFQEV